MMRVPKAAQWRGVLFGERVNEMRPEGPGEAQSENGPGSS